MHPAAHPLLRRLNISLRFFGQQSSNHAHSKLYGNLARATLLELLAQPPVDLLVSGFQTDGDLPKHLHQ